MHPPLRSAPAALALALVLCIPVESAGGGFTLTSFGGRRMGMLSNLGRPDDPTALVHNPAGLADLKGVQIYLFGSPSFADLELSMQALDSDLYPEVDRPVGSDGYYEGTIAPERSFGVLPYIGVTTDLGFISPAGRDVVVSAALYAPNAYGAYFPQDAPTAYNFIGGAFLVGAATVGAGWRINRYIAVGANISYNYMYLSMSQRLSVADALTPSGQQPDTTARNAQYVVGDIRLDFAGTDHGVGWGVGLLITPAPWIGIGVGYDGATPPEFEGDVTFTRLRDEQPDPQRVHDLVGVLGYKLPRRLAIEMVIPPSINAGVMLDATRWLELGLDMRLWLYNLYETQVITPLYAEGTAGKEVITAEALTRNKRYHPSFQLTLGALARPARSLPGLDLMFGVGYDHSPIPDETFTIDNPSLSHMKFNVGARWQIDPRWRVALTYMFVLYLPRDITTSETSPPTNVKGWGVSHSPALAITCTL